jgi:hypothetical protein
MVVIVADAAYGYCITLITEHAPVDQVRSAALAMIATIHFIAERLQKANEASYFHPTYYHSMLIEQLIVNAHINSYNDLAIELLDMGVANTATHGTHDSETTNLDVIIEKLSTDDVSVFVKAYLKGTPAMRAAADKAGLSVADYLLARAVKSGKKAQAAAFTAYIQRNAAEPIVDIPPPYTSVAP